MLCNSVGFNWLACLAATKLEMGFGWQKDEGFPTRGDDDSGRKKKKLNLTVWRESSDSSDSRIGPPI
ncbi:hypothetical protein PVL29_018312 [Vitis rotundifolia]|uniref:Uncharacterized protein n=1 Tax=Vitis rotundifolia TaxID=103349 RepID=A0AA38Z4Q6_VITRO|nr:hypothetical protein PVL29_018312 [Vitis rotundifolia]